MARHLWQWRYSFKILDLDTQWRRVVSFPVTLEQAARWAPEPVWITGTETGPSAP
jgi:hypothetical protein